MNNEDKRLMTDAAREIRSLRQRNEILSAQLYVVDVFAAALGFPKGGMGATVDIAWELDNRVNAAEINKEEPENASA